MRKLYAQDLVVMKDPRQTVQSVVRGSYPVGLCLDTSQRQIFIQQGLTEAQQVVGLDTSSLSGTQLTGGFGNVDLINKAPHPNAAKVYINWLLSQEGQTVYSETTKLNSRRLDVQGPAESAPNPKLTYQDMQKEEFQPDLEAAK